MRPFLLDQPSQFRADPPPALTSHQYAKDLNETEAYGALNSTVRTPEQTAIAYFWVGNNINQYNQTMQSVVAQHEMDLVDAAHLLAVGEIVTTDAGMACFDSKFFYLAWRPITAIRNADKDGNPDTTADPAWQALLRVPGHPEYPSQHGCFTAAFSDALASVLHTNHIDVTMGGGQNGSTVLTTTQHFDTVHDIQSQVIDARVWLGFHFRNSVEQGVKLGNDVADWELRPLLPAGRLLAPDHHCERPVVHGPLAVLGPQGRPGSASGTTHAVSHGPSHSDTPYSGTSYWLQEQRSEWSSTRFAGRAEVAVIGGGVTGCSCALTLASNGVRVRLHEAREIAGGASGRNGGFALRGATVPYDRARAELGDGAARQLMTLTERALDRMEELAGDAFRRVGSLRLAADAAERDALRREHDALRDDGFAVEWVDELPARLGRVVRRRDPASRRRGDPARSLGATPRRACGSGRRGSARARSRSRSTVVDADVVVVAGDGFTASLLPELAAVVRPTRGQVLVTEPLDELLYSRPHYARDGYDYWQQLPDGRLVIGGQRDASLATEDTDVEETTPVIQDRLEQLVAQLVGGTPRVTHRWAGIWGTTPDLMPLAGRVPGRDDTWLAGGYSGHGNALGLACGDLVARAILGDAAAGARPVRSGAARGRADDGRAAVLELEPRQVGDLVRALERGECDREVLDREAGRVERRDLVVAARPPAVPASTSPICVTSAWATSPASTACASSPPWLACSQSSQKRRARSSSEPATSALPGPSAPISETCCPARQRCLPRTAPRGRASP